MEWIWTDEVTKTFEIVAVPVVGDEGFRSCPYRKVGEEERAIFLKVGEDEDSLLACLPKLLLILFLSIYIYKWVFMGSFMARDK